MKKLIALTFTLVVSIAACGGNKDIEEIRKLKDEACACTDKACADAVNKKLDAKIESMKEPSKEDVDTVTQLMAGAGLCISKHQ